MEAQRSLTTSLRWRSTKRCTHTHGRGEHVKLRRIGAHVLRECTRREQRVQRTRVDGDFSQACPG